MTQEGGEPGHRANEATLRADVVLLGLLLAADAAFIAVHLVQVSTGYPSSPLYSLERDRGHAEFFQYTKL